jgi:hypothetical protein
MFGSWNLFWSRLVPVVSGPQQAAAYQIVDGQQFIERGAPVQNLRQYRRRRGIGKIGLVFENVPRAVVYRVLSRPCSVPGTFSGSQQLLVVAISDGIWKHTASFFHAHIVETLKRFGPVLSRKQSLNLIKVLSQEGGILL